jgi:hypothetical protein
MVERVFDLNLIARRVVFERRGLSGSLIDLVDLNELAVGVCWISHCLDQRGEVFFMRT